MDGILFLGNACLRGMETLALRWRGTCLSLETRCNVRRTDRRPDRQQWHTGGDAQPGLGEEGVVLTILLPKLAKDECWSLCQFRCAVGSASAQMHT